MRSFFCAGEDWKGKRKVSHARRYRLKPLSPEHLRRNAPQALANTFDAAQDAAVSLRMMRERTKLTIEALAAVLDITAQRLVKAETGQLTRRAEGGSLYNEMPAALLTHVARATGQKAIPLPWVERD